MKLNLSKRLWALSRDIQRLKVDNHNTSSARLLSGCSQHALILIRLVRNKNMWIISGSKTVSSQSHLLKLIVIFALVQIFLTYHELM
jgi:hypothetical protein